MHTEHPGRRVATMRNITGRLGHTLLHCRRPPSQLPEPNFLPSLPKHPIEATILTHDISPNKVSTQLKRLPAQSIDGLTYEVWKRNRGAAAFSICVTNRRVPRSWKVSTTVLVHKRGDQTQPSNCRPISLQPTIYKMTPIRSTQRY